MAISDLKTAGTVVSWFLAIGCLSEFRLARRIEPLEGIQEPPEDIQAQGPPEDIQELPADTQVQAQEPLIERLEHHERGGQPEELQQLRRIRPGIRSLELA